VAPASQRTHPTHWGSHKDLVRKALAKLAAPHLPASLKALEATVAKAHRAYQQADQTASQSAAAGPGQVRKRDASDDTAEASESVESVDGQELAAEPDLISKAGGAPCSPETPPAPVSGSCRPRGLLAGA
jgi:hypothetical protein